MIKPLRIVGALLFRHYYEPIIERGELYTTDQVVAEAHPRALTVNLEGYRIFPGMINAHDHLEMNHYPRTKFREKYDNAHQWGEDVNTRLDETPFKELRAYPIEDRCFIGGLKNLLCGALTVIHHNPPYPVLFRRSFPVRVIKDYSWTHSLHFSSAADIKRSYARKSINTNWYIHLAEGTDEEAAGEYKRLKMLLGISSYMKVILIHCVGMTAEDVYQAGLSRDGVQGFIWCPSTNLYLLGKTLDVDLVDNRANVNTLGLGSDSRLTADGDYLDEIRAAYAVLCAQGLENPERLLHRMIVLDGAHLALIDALYGYFKPGAPADWIAHPQGSEIYRLHRADLSLIVRGGVPQIGDPALMEKFPHIKTVEATLDGVPKSINVQLARQIKRCSLKEPGLEIMGKVN